MFAEKSVTLREQFFWIEKAFFDIQGKAHKVLQSDSTQTIDQIQKCFRQKFQCSRRPSYWTTLCFYRWRRWSYVKVNSTFLNGTMYFFSIALLPILRRIQRPTTQGHSSHPKWLEYTFSRCIYISRSSCGLERIIETLNNNLSWARFRWLGSPTSSGYI